MPYIHQQNYNVAVLASFHKGGKSSKVKIICVSRQSNGKMTQQQFY